MYTWGYLKEAILAKLDLNEAEANNQNFIDRFPFYANEAITQICSAIKPKHTFYTVKIYNKLSSWYDMCQKYNLYHTTEPIEQPLEYDNDAIKSFWEEWNTLHFVNDIITMPDDFISFGSDVNTGIITDEYNQRVKIELYDEDFTYYGYNQLMFYIEGTFTISYNARWITFSKTMDNDYKLNIPIDILDCIPSYVAHQCYKIDDEEKAAIYRNEYEIFLARIDNTKYVTSKTFKIGGGW